MKVYMLTEADLERLLCYIDRDPKHGRDGGSSNAAVRDRENSLVYDEVHRFYNYQVRKWIDEVSK